MMFGISDNSSLCVAKDGRTEVHLIHAKDRDLSILPEFSNNFVVDTLFVTC
jgi:hypothetical protein